MSSKKPRPLKRVVIKEELVELTGDYIKALILNQFLYWGQRVRDFDEFIQEETDRDPDAQIELAHGWIYKTAADLGDELMLGVSDQTLLRHIDPLIEAGWLERRRNPRYNWDRTWQYRPDLLKIQADLQALGYALEGYPLLVDPISTMEDAISKMENGDSKMEDRSSVLEDRNVENGNAIPEITTETISQITAEDPAPGGAENPAAERLRELRAAVGDNPFQVAATSQKRQEEGAIWTVPVDGGGTNAAGKAMLSAWFRAKGVQAEGVPEVVRERFLRPLLKLAETVPVTPEQAAEAVEVILDKNNPEFGYYTYSSPEVEKFKRDWTEVALRLLSGQPARGGNGDGQQYGLAALKAMCQQRGVV